MANKTTKRYIPTQAYFDPADASLQIVAPNGSTIAQTAVPAEICNAAREEQEEWTREAVRALGRKTRGRVREYPYGFLFNV